RQAELRRISDESDSEIRTERIERSTGKIDDLLDAEHELQSGGHQEQNGGVKDSADQNVGNRGHRSGLRSDLELRGLDPLPEIGARRFLQIRREHRFERSKRDEVVTIIVGREALHECLLSYMILAPGALPAEAFDRKTDQSADDVVLRGPASVLRLRCRFDRRLVGSKRKIGTIGLPLRI